MLSLLFASSARGFSGHNLLLYSALNARHDLPLAFVQCALLANSAGIGGGVSYHIRHWIC